MNGSRMLHDHAVVAGKDHDVLELFWTADASEVQPNDRLKGFVAKFNSR